MGSRTLLAYLHDTSQIGDKGASSRVGVSDTTQIASAAEDALRKIGASLRFGGGDAHGDQRPAQAQGGEDLVGVGGWASRHA
jgi:hypothetical protein